MKAGVLGAISVICLLAAYLGFGWLNTTEGDMSLIAGGFALVTCVVLFGVFALTAQALAKRNKKCPAKQQLHRAMTWKGE